MVRVATASACALLGLQGAMGFLPTPQLQSSSALHSTSSAPSRRMTPMMARKPFIAGNWKLNPGKLDEAVKLAQEVAAATKQSSGVDVAVVPPFPFIASVADAVKGSGVWVGAQDLYTEDKGAFTGAVSTSMISSVGAQWVLVGHSERRSIFKDTDDIVNKKLHKVLSSGLKPILCIGETKDEYEAGLNKMICGVQLGKGLKGVSADQIANVVIAYEPVWAIGTGLTATPEIAQDVHANIRAWFKQTYGDKVADNVIIQYGGSVTPETVDELMACPDIDGALVGGASLVGEKFGRIINFKK